MRLREPNVGMLLTMIHHLGETMDEVEITAEAWVEVKRRLKEMGDLALPNDVEDGNRARADFAQWLYDLRIKLGALYDFMHEKGFVDVNDNDYSLDTGGTFGSLAALTPNGKEIVYVAGENEPFQSPGDDRS